MLFRSLVVRAKAKFPAARRPRRVDRERLEVVHVHHESQPDLLVIVQAGGGSPLLLRPGQGRQQQGGQDGDDGDHHQQLDQREAKYDLGSQCVTNRCIFHEFNIFTKAGQADIDTMTWHGRKLDSPAR